MKQFLVEQANHCLKKKRHVVIHDNIIIIIYWRLIGYNVISKLDSHNISYKNNDVQVPFIIHYL